MTRSELQNLILTRLVRAHGGSRQRWRQALGTIRVYPLDTHPHCNWEARTAGTAEAQAVERMIDTLRHDYPHVIDD